MIAVKVSIFLFVFSQVHSEVQNTGPGTTNIFLSFPASSNNEFNKAEQFESYGEQILRIFQDKCEKNGGPTAFITVDRSVSELRRCIYGIIVGDEPREMCEDRPINDTIRWYCSKVPQLAECYNATTAAVRPCLTSDEGRYLDDDVNAVHNLIGFACQNEGQRVMNFVAAGGSECIRLQEEEITRCANEVAEDVNLDTANLTSDNLLEQLFRRDHCLQLARLKACVVDALRRCYSPRPADFVNSALDIVIRGTPCKNVVETSP